MQSINLNSRTVLPTQAKPATAVWKDRLENSQAQASSDMLAKLLQRAGIIGKEQYCDAAEIAESLKKSVDQVLTTSFLSQEQVEICNGAMTLLDRGLITEALAADGLAVANAKGISFQEGLKYFGFGW